jgi:hypothetical protein
MINEIKAAAVRALEAQKKEADSTVGGRTNRYAKAASTRATGKYLDLAKASGMSTRDAIDFLQRVNRGEA